MSESPVPPLHVVRLPPCQYIPQPIPPASYAHAERVPPTAPYRPPPLVCLTSPLQLHRTAAGLGTARRRRSADRHRPAPLDARVGGGSSVVTVRPRGTSSAGDHAQQLAATGAASIHGRPSPREAHRSRHHEPNVPASTCDPAAALGGRPPAARLPDAPRDCDALPSPPPSLPFSISTAPNS
eukprot:scaffold8400_cov116-Isochrysis_galbana.AAC.6